MGQYERRKLANRLSIVGAIFATGLGLGALVFILATLVHEGFAGISTAVFTQMTPPPGSDGGLLNAIVGSVLMTGVGTLVATPIGIMAGTFLAEFGRYSKIAIPTRFVTDILLSAPSIIIGLFVYEVVVLTTGHFSGWSGAMALGIIVIPVVVRTTEDMLRLVPDSLREAAVGLGAPRWKVVLQICFRAARQGMITGVLLAVARISGETAPLLFTALNNQFWSLDLNGPMANLPVVIFQFAMSPYNDWRELAWTGALLITFFVLSLNILARLMADVQSRAQRGK